MSARAFAENDLAVDTVWERCQLDHDELQTAHLQRAELLRELRTVHELMADREAVLVGESPEKHPGASDTERKHRLKHEIQADPEHKEHRERESKVKFSLDLADAAIATKGKAIDMASARMQELGGLLQYYAAALDAQPTKTTTETITQKAGRQTDE